LGGGGGGVFTSPNRRKGKGRSPSKREGSHISGLTEGGGKGWPTRGKKKKVLMSSRIPFEREGLPAIRGGIVYFPRRGIPYQVDEEGPLLGKREKSRPEKKGKRGKTLPWLKKRKIQDRGGGLFRGGNTAPLRQQNPSNNEKLSPGKPSSDWAGAPTEKGREVPSYRKKRSV